MWEDAADLMEVAGKPLDEWQKHVLRGAMAERADDGKFAAFEVALIMPRQNGKNVVLEARELYGLFLDGECRRITHSAQLFDTARKSFSEFEDLIRGCPALFSRVLGADKARGPHDKVQGIRTGAGEMSIELVDGSKISYKSRSKDGGRGLTGDLVVLDEAYDLTADEIAAMMPTMAARTQDHNPQIWYTSSAGMLSSEYLESVRERGISGGEERMYFVEWSADEAAGSDDLDAWYQANPALGLRISEDYVRTTEFSAMPDEQFRRERLGIWARVGDDAAISRRDWVRLEDPASTAGDRLVFAVDVPPRRDYAEICVASPRLDGKVHIELIDRAVGTAWVVPRLVELQETWDPVGVVVDAGSAAGALVPELLRNRVNIIQMTGREYQQACGNFYDAVRSQKIVHTGQDPLTMAVDGATMKFTGNQLFSWARRTPDANISPLVAATLALEGLNRKEKRTAVRPGSGWKVVAL